MVRTYDRVGLIFTGSEAELSNSKLSGFDRKKRTEIHISNFSVMNTASGPVPEPATLALLMIGAVGVIYRHRFCSPC